MATSFKDPYSKTKGHVHGRVSYVHRGKSQTKKFKVSATTIKIKYKPHTESSIRRKVRNPAGNKYRSVKVKTHTKYVGRKIRRR